MIEKTLIFVPYQDSDNFFDDGILTREFAMLYLFWKAGYEKIINIKKPRTFLDKKRYAIKNEYYPAGTVEGTVKNILDNAETIQYLPVIDLYQIVKRRGWWKNGYKKTIKYLNLIDAADCLVYSDNPYAVEFLEFLSNKGFKVYFDVMDNFAIHPSLNEKERSQALAGYKRIFSFANVISANSQQTCEYMKLYSPKDLLLVKNGVFLSNQLTEKVEFEQLTILLEKKKKYKKCIGYIGKLGQRLDVDLIKKVCAACPEYLFIFIGGFLKDQINQELLRLFEEDNNVMHVSAIPSAYVYAMCDEFDILTIPHACGKAENGGDPLKLYQYLTRKKPIISTPILGVNEFEDIIHISDSVDEWVEFMNNPDVDNIRIPNGISWEDRIAPVMKMLI